MPRSVRRIFGSRRKSGQFGIEVEVEGRRLPSPGIIPQNIVVERDGTLRGPETAEYVLRQPVDYPELQSTLKMLWEAFSASDTEILASHRTSTHVHINVQELHLGQVFSIVMLYAIFEDFLIAQCGKSRVGNKFCLRIKDAEGFIESCIQNLRSTRAVRNLRGDHLRYCALNVNALSKYGSLEFRAFRGTKSLRAITNWVRILKALVDNGSTFQSPVNVVEAIDLIGIEGLAAEMFPDHYNQLFSKHSKFFLQAQKNLLGVLELVYEVDWEQLLADQEGDLYGFQDRDSLYDHLRRTGWNPRQVDVIMERLDDGRDIEDYINGPDGAR